METQGYLNPDEGSPTIEVTPAQARETLKSNLYYTLDTARRKDEVFTDYKARQRMHTKLSRWWLKGRPVVCPTE